MRERILALDPDVVCITEGHLDYLEGAGHAITADADYGYAPKPGRRKIMLWSKRPWRAVDALGHHDLPGGRFVAGTTETALGPLRVIGVCVPWMHAHVATGRRDRVAWEDHLSYLRGLAPLLARPRRLPTLVVGDFNQTIPRTRAPKRVFQALMAALGGFEVATARRVPGAERPTIDHVAHDARLRVPAVGALDATDGPRRLSDHFGVRAVLLLNRSDGPPDGSGRGRRRSPSAP